MATNLTGEFRLDDVVSAMIVAAVDQQPARAGISHFFVRVIIETAREALAKAAQFAEDGPPTLCSRIFWETSHTSAVSALAESEDGSLA
jgi:hypothetical protein